MSVLFRWSKNSFIFLLLPRPWANHAKIIEGMRPVAGGGTPTLPIRVCAAQRGRDFEAPDLERGIHFRGVF